MNKRLLQEVAKFAAGLVAADLITEVWLAGTGMLPVHFMGTNTGPAWHWRRSAVRCAICACRPNRW